MSAVAPRIEEINEREFNTSDSITCTAMGVPEPTVTWTHISGSMPKTATTSGPGIAVLRNLQNGVHTWMCTASSQMGSDSYNVTFTGEYCSVLTLHAMKLQQCSGAGSKLGLVWRVSPSHFFSSPPLFPALPPFFLLSPRSLSLFPSLLPFTYRCPSPFLHPISLRSRTT